MKALMLQIQLGLFIKVILPNFDIFENVLCLIPMKGTTIVENTLKEFMQY